MTEGGGDEPGADHPSADESGADDPGADDRSDGAGSSSERPDDEGAVRPADEGAVSPCSEPDCERAAAVRLYVPWDEDRAVCPAHARVLARPDGVVAEPIEGAEEEWP